MVYSLSERARGFSPARDPWDPIYSLAKHGRHVLTSVEFTVSNRCNMRCEHCAVGDTLVWQEGGKLPMAHILARLDEVEHLQTISITGGEPSFAADTVNDYIVPLVKYARERGVLSQLNSNLTLAYERYAPLLPYLDVMHISFNYRDASDFHAIGFGKSPHPVPYETAARLYERMLDNARRLSSEGMYISAESMINYRTHQHLPQLHELIVQMGCQRHEVHPMYPSAFARNLPVLSHEQMLEAIASLLDRRDPEIWMLFGTLPFFACNDDARQQALLSRLHSSPNVTVRNDPDGRNRLNVNLFTGDVFVTDFSDVPSFGNLADRKLDELFESWLAHPLAQSVNCHCPAVACCGPNLLVKDMYYPAADFRSRRAIAGTEPERL